MQFWFFFIFKNYIKNYSTCYYCFKWDYIFRKGKIFFFNLQLVQNAAMWAVMSVPILQIDWQFVFRSNSRQWFGLLKPYMAGD